MNSSCFSQRLLWLAVAAVLPGVGVPAFADQPAVQPLITLAEHEYWIGVACSPLDAALRAQADLPQDRGVVIARVVRGSPAEKAGLKQYDVVVEAGETPVAELKELIQAIQRNHDKEISLQVIRSSQRMSLAVTPERRRKCTRILVLGKLADRERSDELQQWVGRLESQKEDEGAFAVESFRPGVIVGRVPHRGKETESPKDLRITITEGKDSPTTIKLEQGEESWEVTDAGRGKCSVFIILCPHGETGEDFFSLEQSSGYFVYRANVHRTETTPRFQPEP